MPEPSMVPTDEDLALIIVLQKSALPDFVARLIGAPATPAPEPGAPAPTGITNVPVVGQQDTLDAMGVDDPGTPAEHQASQLIVRSAYYDAVSKEKAKGL